MEKKSGFYTMKGYQQQEQKEVTPAMEDYLEMICRLAVRREEVRVKDLAAMLHVKPSSATKMIQQLSAAEYITAPKYGAIGLTDKGYQAGTYLLYRHEVIHRFLRRLNGSEDELDQAEKIEHFINEETVRNLDELTQFLESL